MILLSKTGLVAAFVLTALLLISANLYSRWSWRVKAALIVIVSAFYIVTYFSIPPLLGWPSESRLPDRFNLVAVYVQEPDKATGAQGEIFLWATDMDNTGYQVPRAYTVPFTSELHARVVEAGNKMRKGLPQLGEAEYEELGPSVRPSDESQAGQISVKVDFYDLPDPLFPEK